MYKYITIEKLSENIGVSISNININNINDETVEEIKDALYNNIVIFIKNQKNIQPDDLIKFSKYFGNPSIYTYNKKHNLPPEITPVERLKESNDIPIGSSGWHTDSSYLETPPIFTMLYSINIPKIGGNTLFRNCYKIYDSIDDKIKNKINNLKILNSSNLRQWFNGEKDFYNLSKTPKESFHNSFIIHPITKKKSIYMDSIHTHYIKDLPKNESDDILNYIFDLVSDEKTCYNHKWEENTIAIWDNRCCQHLALDDCHGEYRLLWRIILNNYN